MVPPPTPHRSSHVDIPTPSWHYYTPIAPPVSSGATLTPDSHYLQLHHTLALAERARWAPPPTSPKTPTKGNQVRPLFPTPLEAVTLLDAAVEKWSQSEGQVDRVPDVEADVLEDLLRGLVRVERVLKEEKVAVNRLGKRGGKVVENVAAMLKGVETELMEKGGQVLGGFCGGVEDGFEEAWGRVRRRGKGGGEVGLGDVYRDCIDGSKYPQWKKSFWLPADYCLDGRRTTENCQKKEREGGEGGGNGLHGCGELKESEVKEGETAEEIVSVKRRKVGRPRGTTKKKTAQIKKEKRGKKEEKERKSFRIAEEVEEEIVGEGRGSDGSDGGVIVGGPMPPVKFRHVVELDADGDSTVAVVEIMDDA